MVTIRAHHDADGITAAYFLSLTIPDSKIQLWDGQFGDTTGLQSGDFMVDMRPKQNMEGLTVYDHHGPYPEDRKYNLYTSEEPASWIVWTIHKDKIPKDKWWILAIGLLGDGQPELIPYEVFKTCPMLLTKIKTSTFQNYGKWKNSYYPLYKLLSSKVNALLRIRAYDAALKLILTSENPMDILNSKEASLAKSKVKTEFETIMRSCEVYTFENLNVYIYESNYRMAGYIATVMNQEEQTTVLAINRVDGSGSLRGDLALYWREVLKELGYLEVDGHPGFMGARLMDKPEVLISDLAKRFLVEDYGEKF
jgi:hypothetical protein